ncbi:Retrovirus-related Pol polyprotein from transposon 17.6 [Araneus ventricosus]|uniref:RNA-directed DNA polymerase n=1 Tax=Araneus ventricosus TaxID=182803 RepID=A0A4Y2E9I4_ARAVE|nr:Retrovirus-related Pol polyprotein from transposon 17.6 [Araneus ventricosus]
MTSNRLISLTDPKYNKLTLVVSKSSQMRLGLPTAVAGDSEAQALSMKGLYFNGRKDSTFIEERLDTKRYTGKAKQEHLSLIEEPVSRYITHLSPSFGTAKQISETIIGYFDGFTRDLSQFLAFGCDGTSVNTGWFRFQRLPFGISSAPEHFKRRMSQMLEGIPGTICHMDDILLWVSTQEEHDQRLTEVCKRLKNSGMTLNAKKSNFSQTSIKFLGHIIDGQGIQPDPDKIAAIENYHPPTNKKELKQLLGMANYLARFVPNYSDILFPLTSMLSNKVTFVWEAPQEAAFQKMKKILSSDPVLMIFDPGKETTITTDASSYGLGATICQKQADGRRLVIAYASRTLTPTESRYAQIEKEALAVVWGCEKFRDYLTGMHFKIETDHKPLIPIFSKKNLDDLSPRLQRIKLRMMKFSYTIAHIPGKELFAADALSRNPQKVPYKREELEAEIDAFIQMITSSLPASSRRLDELRVAQLKDETCQKLTDYVLKGWPSKKEVDTLCAPYWQNRYEISVQDGLLMRGCRIIIPKSHQAEVLNQILEGHLGITKGRARARCSVYWLGISKVIEEKIKSCTASIQESNYYSRCPEIARLDRLTSAGIINHCKSIFSRHGIPDVVRSDNGSQFDPVKTVEFKDITKSYGFTHISSSPKFSQSNGLIEAAVKTVKARIKKFRDPDLPLMTYRATPLENGFSPSELLMGRRISTTLPVAKTQLQPYSVNKKVLEAKEERQIEGQKTNYDKHDCDRNLDELDPGQNVWITDRRVTGKVLQETPYPRSYLVQSGRRVYRRKRKHLIPSPDFHPEPEPEDDFDVTVYQHSPADADTGCPPLISSPQSPKTYPERASSSTEASPDTYVTRSGRTVRPPERLDL